VHYTTRSNTQFTAPEDGRNHRPKHVELIGIINKPLLLHLAGVYIIYINKYHISSINLVGKGFLSNFKLSFKFECDYLLTYLLEYFSWPS